MPWYEWLVIAAAIAVIVAVVLVIRTNRRDEKDVWKTPEDFGDPEDHRP